MPCSEDRVRRASCSICAAASPLRRHDRVGLHDPAGQPGLEPAPGQRPVHEVHHRRIHRPGRLRGEVPGPGGDPAGVPDPRLPGDHPGPDQRQPVPHVQRVGDQLPGGPRADLQPGTQLGPGELRHRRRPGTADPDRALQARQHRPRRPGGRYRVAGVLVREHRRQREQVRVRPGPDRVQAGHLIERRYDAPGDRSRWLPVETPAPRRNRPGTGVPDPVPGRFVSVVAGRVSSCRQRDRSPGAS